MAHDQAKFEEEEIEEAGTYVKNAVFTGSELYSSPSFFPALNDILSPQQHVDVTSLPKVIFEGSLKVMGDVEGFQRKYPKLNNGRVYVVEFSPQKLISARTSQTVTRAYDSRFDDFRQLRMWEDPLEINFKALGTLAVTNGAALHRRLHIPRTIFDYSYRPSMPAGEENREVIEAVIDREYVL